jgi:hypothetical protein
MNKTWMIVIACVAGLALILSAVGVVFLYRSQGAQSMMFGNRLWSNSGNDRGFGMGMGMMNGGRGANNRSDARTDMQSYYITALAEQFDTTSTDLQNKLQSGTSLLDLASDKGLTVNEYQSLIETAQTSAVDKALADGVISQNQADLMKSTDAGTGWFGKGMGFGWCY